MLDDRAVPLAPVRAQRRPDRERRAPAATSPGRGSPSSARGSSMSGRYAAPEPKTRVQQLRIADEREPVLVGHVQPLVAVGDHRVGTLDALHQVPRSAATARRTARTRRPRGTRRRGARPGPPSSTSGSKSPAFTSPALPITIAGRAVQLARAPPRSRRGRRVRRRRARASARWRARPPACPSAFTSLGCVYPPPSTVIGGAAAQPALVDVDAGARGAPASRARRARRSSPSSRRSSARRPRSAGRPNSSFSQSIDTCSRRPAEGRGDPGARVLIERRGEPVGAERGRRRPAVDEVEELRPGGVHRAVDRAEAAPSGSRPRRSPCSGSGPPKVAATSSARGSRTGRSAMPARYASASRAVRSHDVVELGRIGCGHGPTC